ncbi:hypothetical protein [Cellulomonas sp. URHB0016]
MSTGLHGADTDALRTQAVALHDAAQTLTACAQRTGRDLDAVVWRGADADRTREQWRTEHARSLLTCAVSLEGAARRLLDEAAEQDHGSGVSGGSGSAATTGASGAAPTTGAAGRTWKEVRADVDLAHDIADTALKWIGRATNATDAVLMAGAASRWTNITREASYRVLDRAHGIMQGAHIGPAVGGVLQGAAALGVASNVYGVYRAHTTGDLHGTVNNAVSAVLGAGGFVPGLGLASTALGASWDVGTAAGTTMNDAMQGTAFGDRFSARMDGAFEVGGAWGMLNTPGALLVTAGEEVGLAAQGLWDGVTRSGSGTVGPPQ